MRVTFVMPNLGRLESGEYVDEGSMEPLPLAVLAGLTPPDVECVLYDDRLEAIPYDEPTDLVALSVEIYTARRAYEIAAEYRRRGVPVVLGGMHPTLVPREAMAHADAVCVGDAECVWATIVEDARNGRLRRRYDGAPGVAQAGGVRPRRDLYAGKPYLPVTLLQFSRGCRYACSFCAISRYFDRRHHVRRTEEVLAEIEAQERRFLFFVDDNFLSDHAAAKAFLRALIPLKVRWVSQGSIDMTDDPELMELLEASGCFGHVIGFESLQRPALRAMAKGPALRSRRDGATDWDRYARAIEVLRRHHLQTWAAFTLGHDDDTEASIRETCDFALAHKFCFAAFNILMPYPGTPLYDRLAAQGRLLFDGQWWLHPEYRFNHAAFVPARMSPEALTAACFDARRRWNSPVSVVRRFWDPMTHLSSPARAMLYLAYNPLYRKETHKKQGMRLGYAADSIHPGVPGP
ncbi:MAG TPA: radical SAM protein, partial [Gemmatimonadaceae bacterium]|nr:radical SAM protein [Gemmatimonadaceae bacterium]